MAIGGIAPRLHSYRRYVHEADTAVLMLHGITGSPKHFAPVVTEVPENWTLVSHIRLTILPASGHLYYPPSDLERLRGTFRRLISN